MRTALCLLLAFGTVPGIAALARADGGPKKWILGKEMDEAEFTQAQKELTAGLAMAAAFDKLGGGDVPWTEPPTYDTQAQPFTAFEPTLSAADMPVRVERSGPDRVEISIDAST